MFFPMSNVYNHLRHSLSSTEIRVFEENHERLLYQQIQIWIEVFQCCFNDRSSIFQMLLKLATVGFLKIKAFGNKYIDIMIFIHGVTKKNLISLHKLSL